MKCPECGEGPIILRNTEFLDTVTNRTYYCSCGCEYITHEELDCVLTHKSEQTNNNL